MASFITRLKRRFFLRYPALAPFSQCLFSQEGEDILLRHMIGMKRNGFYVDIGAHHPFRFSNTYLFYLRGWRGINVDPMPGSMQRFNEYRPGDINLECGVSDVEMDMTYHQYSEPALNGFTLLEPDAKKKINLTGSISIPTKRLSAIFEEHLPTGQQIDFMSVDVEGHDLNVLRSNDWSRYCPGYVLVEDRSLDLMDIRKSETAQFMMNAGYSLACKTFLTCIYKRLDNTSP